MSLQPQITLTERCCRLSPSVTSGNDKPLIKKKTNTIEPFIKQKQWAFALRSPRIWRRCSSVKLLFRMLSASESSTTKARWMTPSLKKLATWYVLAFVGIRLPTQRQISPVWLFKIKKPFLACKEVEQARTKRQKTSRDWCTHNVEKKSHYRSLWFFINKKQRK